MTSQQFQPDLRTLAEVLRDHAARHPDAPALLDGERAVSWHEFDERTSRLAQAFIAAGVAPGDRILWLGQNSYRVQELLLAAAKTGAMFCPANWRQQPNELAFVIDDLAPKVIIGQIEEVGETIAAGRAASTAAADARWIVHDSDGPDSYEAFLASGASADDPRRDTSTDLPVLLIYTAAFGGTPNAAMLPHRALVAQAALMAPWMGVDESHRYLNAGPMFHVGVFMENLATFVAGGTNVFVRRSDGTGLAEAIATHRCTGGYLVGPMIQAVVDANADATYDLSSFRGKRGHPEFDAWVQPNESAWSQNAGGYGQTETNGMMTYNLLAPDGIGPHGAPSPLVEIRIVDPDDNQVPTGETGEITVRGVTAMLGYWDRDDLNAERRRGGWHHTNDLGRVEADGSFTFVGPKQRMIKSAAENIYPVEVEGALRRHPAVKDVAIIGVPDEKWVQSVKAIVVLEPDTTASASELIDFCKTRIASYKKPRTVEFVDELPRQGWAVDYDALDAAFGGGNYPGGRVRSA